MPLKSALKSVWFNRNKSITCPRYNLCRHEVLWLMRLAFSTLQPRENLILRTIFYIWGEKSIDLCVSDVYNIKRSD